MSDQISVYGGMSKTMTYVIQCTMSCAATRTTAQNAVLRRQPLIARCALGVVTALSAVTEVRTALLNKNIVTWRDTTSSSSPIFPKYTINTITYDWHARMIPPLPRGCSTTELQQPCPQNS